MCLLYHPHNKILSHNVLLSIKCIYQSFIKIHSQFHHLIFKFLYLTRGHYIITQIQFPYNALLQNQILNLLTLLKSILFFISAWWFFLSCLSLMKFLLVNFRFLLDEGQHEMKVKILVQGVYPKVHDLYQLNVFIIIHIVIHDAVLHP